MKTKYQTYKYGLQVFNYEKQKFKRWLCKENLQLNGKKPCELINNLKDLKEVYNVLDRINYGNFA